MVTRFGHRSARQRGVLMVELLAAILLLTAALLPLAYSVSSEKRLARAMYQRAIAMEIVDGEMEALAAGGWRTLTNGVSEYHVHAAAAANLPPGKFIVAVTPPKVRLEWRPEVKGHGGSVVREVRVR
jgi:Tfp pilus assembly protein PilX